VALGVLRNSKSTICFVAGLGWAGTGLLGALHIPVFSGSRVTILVVICIFPSSCSPLRSDTPSFSLPPRSHIFLIL
jgi:hypothetical protein